MATTQTTDPSTPMPKDPTFRNYAPAAAAAYAQYRPGYPDKLIDTVISQHTSTGGGRDLLLDVGCGPGTATRSLAPLFQHAVGVDPGQSMIETARTIASSTARGEPVRYEVCAAEELDSVPGIAPESVDLVTAATAAHWFDLPRFYATAAKVLKPGGTIALWASGHQYCDPYTTPNAVKVQQLLFELELEIMRPYERAGNGHCRELYANLALPWTILAEDEDIGEQLKIFDQDAFVRLEFNKDGALQPGEKFFRGRRSTLDQVKNAIGTISHVTRWREAHKDQLEKGEVEDCADMIVRRVRETMEEVPEGKGRDWLEGGSSTVILIIKKRA